MGEITPQSAYEKRYAGVDNGAHTWGKAPPHVQEMWMAAWTIAWAMATQMERNECEALCLEWARICDSGKRHGAKIGAQECARLIEQRDREAND